MDTPQPAEQQTPAPAGTAPSGTPPPPTSTPGPVPLADSVLPPNNTSTSPPPAPPPAAPPEKNKRSLPKISKPIVLIAGIVLLLVSIPVIGLMVNQRNQIADTRSRAAVCTVAQPACTNACRSIKGERDGGRVEGRCVAGKTDGGVPNCECFCAAGGWDASYSFCQGTPEIRECTPGESAVRQEDGCRYNCSAQAIWVKDQSSCPGGGGPVNTPTPVTVCAGQGALNQACRAPQNCNNAPNCNDGLVCMGGVCRPTGDDTSCSASGRCRVCTCNRCTDYGGGLPECRDNCVDVACNVATLNGCGQIDFLNSNSQYCGVKQQACTGNCAGGTPPPGPSNTPLPSPTPTPVIAQCSRIRIYQDGQVVSDPSTLRPGNQVVLAVSGSNAQRGRIRVNGAQFNETTTTNSTGEFTVPFTIPTGVTTFTIEAEVFRDGQWL